MSVPMTGLLGSAFALSTLLGCNSADSTEVGSAKRKVVNKDDGVAMSNDSPVDATSDASAGSGASEDEAARTPSTRPTSTVDHPGSALSFSGLESDQAPTLVVEVDASPPLAESETCAVAWVQHVDVPRALRANGGSVELRRVFDTDSGSIPNVVSTPWTPVAASEQSFDITTEGSDLQLVLFRDVDGRVVDAQWHQSRCSAARPARSDAVLDVPETYPTIQAAIDAAGPGDTVRVAPGVYFETLKLRPQVTLLGAGPNETILDARGEVTKLVDATGAFGASVIGFRFRNVGMGGSCGRPEDGLACSGEHYPVALYADGHMAPNDEDGCCHASTFFAAHNVFEGNAYGVMAYHRTHAVLFDNVFVGNTNAVVANHAADAFTLLENNLFLATNTVDIASSAARIFAAHNAFEGDLDCAIRYIQRGRYACNAFSGDVTCDALTPEDDRNFNFADDVAAAAAVASGCLTAMADAGAIQWFDLAGETGRTHGQ